MDGTARIPVVLEIDSDGLPPGQETGTSPEEYTYDPLPDSHFFRVLELLPGYRSSRLECQLHIERLGGQDLPPYRAVSYTWTESKYDNLVIAGKRVTEFPGPREKYLIQHPVWISGRRLLISTNLRDALRTFRHSSRSLRLWVDAVCINQGDLDEQSNQVLLMPRIYHSALAVWFWVGEADDPAQVTMSWMSALDDALAETESESSQDIKLGIGPDEAKAFVSFLQRPVFQRIWIVQELVTGRNIMVYCGVRTASFRAIQIALDSFSRQSLDVAFSKQYSPGYNYFHCVNVILKMQREWYLKRRNVRKHLVLATRNFMATNPKDKVFALMGLFNDFAHRDSCHLGLCEKPHSLPQIDTLEALPNIKINRDTESDFGRVSKAVTGAIRELLSHEREVQQVNQERSAACILCTLEHAQDIRHCLIEYLRIFTRDLEEFTQIVGRADFGASATEEGTEEEEKDGDEEEKEQEEDEEEDEEDEEDEGDEEEGEEEDNGGEDGEDEDEENKQRVVKHIQNFLGREFEAYESKVAQGFTAHIARTLRADWKQMENLAGYQDTMKLCENAAKVAMRRVRYFLDLLAVDTTEKHTNDGDEKNELNSSQAFCNPEIYHSNLVTYTPGQISFGYCFGRYMIACSSCDEDIFGTAVEAIGRSQSPPHEGCTLKEPSWRLLKAVLGDMTEWNQDSIGGGMLSKGEIVLGQDGRSPAEVPNVEGLVDAKWLGMSLSQYLEKTTEDLPRPETDRRDPLQHWSWSPSISRMPDYRLSVSEIYREFALRCLNDDPDLFILSTIEDHSLRRVGLPSWTPDFSVPLTRPMLAYPSLDVMVPYLESAEGKRGVMWSDTEPDTLILQGHMVGVIQDVLNPGVSAQVRDIVHQTIAFAQDFPLEYPTGEVKPEALWRTLTANVGNTPTYEYPAPKVFAQFFAAYSKHGATASEEDIGGLQIEDSSSGAGNYSGGKGTLDPNDFTDAVSHAMGERKFFVTEDKLYGIGPQSVQRGDMVFLFAGGRVPYVIRPHGTNGTIASSFVGECYCHGICHGQALSESGFTWESISLV